MNQQSKKYVKYLLPVFAIAIFSIAILTYNFEEKIPEVQAADVTGDFTDANFLACASATLGTPGSVDDAAAAAFSGEIVCNNQGVTSLAGIQHFTSLVGIKIDNNSINDAGFAPIAAATAITSIDMMNNSVTDITPLASLSNIIGLGIGGNDVNDLSPLIGHSNLNLLHIWCNDIDNTSIASVTNANFPNLTDLRIGPSCGKHSITNLSPLSGMNGLTILHINQNNLTDAMFAQLNIQNMIALTDIDFDGNNAMTNFNAIAGLDNLVSTDIGNNNGITSLNALGSGNANLADFASGNSITITNNAGLNNSNAPAAYTNVLALQGAGATVTHNLNVTADFNDPNFLSCVSNDAEVGTPGAVAYTDAIAVTSLACDSLSIASINGIEHLNSLQYFDCSGNTYSDISKINTTNTPNLLDLGIGNNNIVDISSLDGLASLFHLGVWNNSITDISTVPNLSAVSLYNIGGNTGITDFDALNVVNYPLLNNLGSNPNILLYNTQLSPADLTRIVSEFPNLRSINLCCGMLSLTDSDFAPIADLINLTNISLSDNGGIIRDISFLNDGTNANGNGGSACEPTTQDCSCTNCFADNNTINLTNISGLNGANAAWALRQVDILEESAGVTVTHNITGSATVNFYVDYAATPGASVDCSVSDPCASLDELRQKGIFTANLLTATTINVYVTGEKTTSIVGCTPGGDCIDRFGWSGGTNATINILKDPSGTNPILDARTARPMNGEVLLLAANSTASVNVQDFEIYGDVTVAGAGDATSIGIYTYGNGLNIRNNYIHDTSVGIWGHDDTGGGGPTFDNNIIANNIFINNRGTTNFGGAVDTCGGIWVTGPADNISIINNTAYNNCNNFADGGLDTIGQPLELGEITVTEITDSFGISAPTNTTVKQNLVYNTLGGGANTYYYNVPDGVGGWENINSADPGGILTGQTAADHGTGNNFIAASDPFLDSSGPTTDWADAGVDFALTASTYVTYQIGSLHGNTPSSDYLGTTRPYVIGEAGAIEYQDPIVPPANYYVDYDSGVPGDCGLSTTTNPCDSITNLFSEAGFQTIISTDPKEPVNVYVEGTSTTAEQVAPALFAVTVTSTEIHIQPWNINPIINAGPSDANILVVGNNITIDGFEIYGSSVEGGLILIGDNIIAKNNYIHNMVVGIVAIEAYSGTLGFDYASSNISIQNNIITNNTDNVAGCGGIYIGEVNGAEVINNTLYNNCDFFNPDTSAGNVGLGDIGLSRIDFLSNTSPTGTLIVKQNLVYNDNGGAENTYYYEADITVNGSAVGRPALTNQTAADLGTGNNFAVTSNDPFTNSGGGANWTAAGADFALTSSAYTIYRVASLHANTPTTDYLGITRPDSSTTGEAGALEYVVSGGSSRQETCTTTPITLNLSKTLPVSTIDGKPAVNLSWTNIQDVNTDVKVSILLSYFDQNPKIGSEKNRLSNIFTTYARGAISNIKELSSYYYNRLERLGLTNANDSTCNNSQSEAILSIITNARKDISLKASTDNIIMKFINDLLSLESTLKEAGSNLTPFTDYYRNYFLNANTGGVIHIYRDGTKIHTVTNTYNTSYTDKTVPANKTNKAKYYNYYLINETDCGTAIGNSGKAAIDPVVAKGTEIDVTLDLNIKIKGAYDQLIMDRVHELIETNDNSNIAGSRRMCKEIQNEFRNARNSELALEYVLECYAEDNYALRHKIEAMRADIISPLMILLSLSADGNLDSEDIIDKFMEPIIANLVEQIEIEETVLEDISKLGLSDSLLSKNSIDELTEDERELILQINEEYFGDNSHGANLTINKYEVSELSQFKSDTFTGLAEPSSFSDLNPSSLGSLSGIGIDKANETYQTTTNLLGEASVSVGSFKAGTSYIIGIELADEKYYLPKIATLEINNAKLTNNNYTANIALEFDRHFKYGNFDESDNEINKNDLIAWGNLLKNNPESWDEGNIDGITGINILDVISFQENWGMQESMDVEEGEITISELFQAFGLTIPKNLSISLIKVEIPMWLNYADKKCN
ncbi:hypothetical protein KKA95_04355 [Patescibacteria group bacterium]|nr:hypothetical protein [Patescibacteria group bacterium]